MRVVFLHQQVIFKKVYGGRERVVKFVTPLQAIVLGTKASLRFLCEIINSYSFAGNRIGYKGLTAVSL